MKHIAKTESASVATLGVDIGKNTFHLVGLDKRGAIVVRERLSRTQVEVRLANMAPSWSAWRPASVPITWAGALLRLATTCV
jgi:hypothetical protein